jgi:ABC-type thiamine transport system ATPase subunit
VPSLRLHALVWQADDSRLRLELTVPSDETAVVAADPKAGTALADVLLGLTPPLGGAVRLDGRDVTGLAAGTRGIALVPVGGGLLPHVNVERNIAYGGDPAHAEDRVRDLQLGGIQKQHPHELSPAQRLQVAVARALCHARESVAIVFEDRFGQAPFHAAVDTARAYGATVLVITDLERGVLLGDVVRPEELDDAT